MKKSISLLIAALMIFCLVPFSASAETITIDEFDVVGISIPVAGMTAEEYDDAIWTQIVLPVILEDYWDIGASGCEIQDSEGNLFDGVFQAGSLYKLVFDVGLYDGINEQVFAPDVKVNVHDSDSVSVTYVNEHEIHVEITYTAIEANEEKITSIDLELPTLAGEAVSHQVEYFTCNNEHVILSARYRETIDNSAHVTAIEDGKVYYVETILQAIDGYVFDDSVTVTLNGNKASPSYTNIDESFAFFDFYIRVGDPTPYEIRFEGYNDYHRIYAAGEYTLPECMLNVPEYRVFDCWMIGAYEYNPGDTVTITDDIYIYAQWKNDETINYVIVNGINLYAGDYLAENANETTTEKPEGGFAYLAYSDSDGYVLTLNNFDLTPEDTNGIVSAVDLTIKLVGDNSINMGDLPYDGIVAYYTDLAIEGTGSITIRGSEECIYCEDGDFTLSDATLTLWSADDGVRCDDFFMGSGTIDVTNCGCCAVHTDNFYMTGGKITMYSEEGNSDGIYTSNGTLSVTGGSIIGGDNIRDAFYGRTLILKDCYIEIWGDRAINFDIYTIDESLNPMASENIDGSNAEVFDEAKDYYYHYFTCGSAFLEGDVNGDDSVDMFDYMIVKSAYFGGYELSEEEFLRADIATDGSIDMFDYMTLKTICFS